MSRRVRILYGPPGTGKTTRALDIVDAALEDGVPPERIAYLSFTRKAANEAVDRACKRFGFDHDQFPYFRTLHSLGYKLLDLNQSQVMGPKHWKELAEKTGFEILGDYDEDMERVDRRHETAGDRMLSLYGLARARGLPVSDEWLTGDWTDIQPWAVKEFQATLANYKMQNGLLDFADMLDDCSATLDVDLFVVDEAQDLTPQQWAFARRVARDCNDILLAGDDDQAIFEWAGADVEQFNRFRGERTVLPLSHRLTKAVYQESVGILSGVKRRVKKHWAPRPEDGCVDRFVRLEHVDLTSDRWLLLARNRAKVDRMEYHVRQQGFPYIRDGRKSTDAPYVKAVLAYEHMRAGHTVTLEEARLVCKYVSDVNRPTRNEHIEYEDIKWPWEGRPPWMEAMTGLGSREREYVRAIRRRGESLTKPPRLLLSTIHGAKGGEENNVLLMGGSTRRIQRDFDRHPDAEHRVWYVGATRAKERLVLLGEPNPH